ncbi:MAG: hypothetical protein IPJ13_25605 [Saprospiraceae bacterium]|nr:hypothetical protein [Saprospiraceae bacterium]
MLKTIFIIIVILHGLIHLFGFVKAFEFADVSALNQEISKPAGFIWLIGAILFVITALLLMFRVDAWTYFWTGKCHSISDFDFYVLARCKIREYCKCADLNCHCVWLFPHEF